MEYIKIPTSFIDYIHPLSNREAGRFFRYLLQSAETGETPKVDIKKHQIIASLLAVAKHECEIGNEIRVD